MESEQSAIRKGFSTGLILAILFVPILVEAQQPQAAASRMNERGPENSQMAEREGIWDVIDTTA